MSSCFGVGWHSRRQTVQHFLIRSGCLQKCLQWHPKDRPSIDQLLGHPYITGRTGADLGQISSSLRGVNFTAPLSLFFKKDREKTLLGCVGALLLLCSDRFSGVAAMSALSDEVRQRLAQQVASASSPRSAAAVVTVTWPSFAPCIIWVRSLCNFQMGRSILSVFGTSFAFRICGSSFNAEQNQQPYVFPFILAFFGQSSFWQSFGKKKNPAFVRVQCF